LQCNIINSTLRNRKKIVISFFALWQWVPQVRSNDLMPLAIDSLNLKPIAFDTV